MADIFLSYKKEDLDRLKPIIDGLEGEGFTVWWDYQIETGTDWWDSIVREIAISRGVVGCWTANSVKPNKAFASTYVDEEHSLGSAKLAPILLDAGRIPVAYKNIEAAVLTNWDGSLDHAEWRNLVARVEMLATPKWVRRRYAELDGLKQLETRRREAAEAELAAALHMVEQLTAENAVVRAGASQPGPTQAATPAIPEVHELRAPLPTMRNATWLAGGWLVADNQPLVEAGTPLIELHTIVGGDVATVRAPVRGRVEKKAVNSHAMVSPNALLAIFKPA